MDAPMIDFGGSGVPSVKAKDGNSDPCINIVPEISGSNCFLSSVPGQSCSDVAQCLRIPSGLHRSSSTPRLGQLGMSLTSCDVGAHDDSSLDHGERSSAIASNALLHIRMVWKSGSKRTESLSRTDNIRH